MTTTILPTAKQIELVQASFAQVAPIADQAAGLFYSRLFEVAPDVKPFFKSDMKSQGRKLMMTLSVVVGSLKDLGAIMPTVRKLAVKHVDYGVEPRHYAKVGEALIWTLEQGLGAAFTLDTREAWISTYKVLAGAMIEAAYGMKSAA